MGMSRQIILLLVCAFWPSVSVGTVLNVPTAAYPTIQSAIQAAVAGDEVVVAPGVYNEAISFGATAITVRSSGGSAVTTIDASGLDLRVVKFFPGSGPATQLSGFTITGGQRLGTEPHDRGAGIYCDRASPTIDNCIVEGNQAVVGGGLAARLGDPTVTNCVFRNNHATFEGGAVFNLSADPSFDQCTFELNQADVRGGAMANISSSPTLTDCFFDRNSSGLLAGAMYNQGSNLGAADPTITGCTFRSKPSLLG
ncbi:MAG: right-handed parallel beta-helix repeat-containing protein, partial [Planctomycetes bacterium]|nr:right-handed parallel beta-helix repeat-containing protein [Planctomycetota bacterium]